jgi:hypothetical protein
MFGRNYSPIPSPFSRVYYPTLMSPFRGILGSVLTLAGIIVIANAVAPQLVEQVIPGWRSRYGALVLIGVGLGALRSLFRLFVPLTSLGFWVLAVFALAHAGLPEILTPASSVKAVAETVREAAPGFAQSGQGLKLIGSKSLPEAAYFPAQRGGSLETASKNPIVSQITRLFR